MIGINSEQSLSPTDESSPLIPNNRSYLPTLSLDSQNISLLYCCCYLEKSSSAAGLSFEFYCLKSGNNKKNFFFN